MDRRGQPATLLTAVCARLVRMDGWMAKAATTSEAMRVLSAVGLDEDRVNALTEDDTTPLHRNNLYDGPERLRWQV